MVFADHFTCWSDELSALVKAIRAATEEALAHGEGPRGAPVSRPIGRGAGDLTYGLDAAAERAVDAWFRRVSRTRSLSLLTEDRGWRHAGPDGELPDFDHGGPRIALDPVDGTRNLMFGLRPAWCVVSFAPPGAAEPRLSDLAGGIVAELPLVDAPVIRELRSDGALCAICVRPPFPGSRGTGSPLRVDDDDRPDHGYFPIFRYEHALRPALARLEADFFARLEREEGARLETIYDDQYISNAGQLFQTATGVYRMIADVRALLAERLGRPTTTSKPYDVAGAILCARAAGVVVTAADGGELDFPLDATTPVHFVAWANERTRRRLEPHWLAALAAWEPEV